MAVLAALCIPAQAQETDKKTAPAKPQRVAPAETPKASSPLDRFNMTTNDTGEKMQYRLELNLSKNNDLFLFGDRTTSYPTARKPYEDYQPSLPQVPPKDTYSIGIGRRF
jgi:hypothetical protein